MSTDGPAACLPPFVEDESLLHRGDSPGLRRCGSWPRRGSCAIWASPAAPFSSENLELGSARPNWSGASGAPTSVAAAKSAPGAPCRALRPARDRARCSSQSATWRRDQQTAGALGCHPKSRAWAVTKRRKDAPTSSSQLPPS